MKLTFLQDIIQYEFLQKALFTSIVVGVLAGVIGSFIVLRGMALMGDAISHAILPGVAISYMLDISFFFGAVVFGILASIGIGFVDQNSKIKSDTSIGIVFSSFFALGIILLMKAQTAIDLTQILFGNVLTVRTSEMWLTVGVGIGVLACVYLFYKEFLITSFDETMAKVYGMNTKLIHYFMMILLTLVTVVSLKTVGVVLVVAMLITPAATAYLLTHKLKSMMALSATIGALSSVIGLYLSFEFNLTSGAIIVLVATGFFILAFLFAPKRGVVWNKLRSYKNKKVKELEEI